MFKRKKKLAVKSKNLTRAREVKTRVPQTLRGMKDILPQEQKFWHFLEGRVEKLAEDYTFKKIDLPILEETSLFVRSVGRQTDIVEKEMFAFQDTGGENVALRPEATASIARAYIEHGMVNLPQPVKLYYEGPMFRHERPQAGRLRQFHQFGFEVLGENHPVIDAQIILMAYNFYKQMGIDTAIQVNSIGCTICRPEYIKALVDYYRTKRSSLCENCKKRLIKNPLRILDCKEVTCQEIRGGAPQVVDWLCDICRDHFVKVLEYLDELEAPYVLNPLLVRGLDYYTKTVFELWSEDDAKGENTLAGGGRYDDLVETLGGRPTPACGFSAGLERTIQKIKEKDIPIKEEERPKLYLAQLGEQARRKGLVLFEELKKEGLKAVENFSKDGLKVQLETANKLGVKLVLILGQKEVLDGTILIRDMDGAVQEVIDYQKVVPEIKKRLGGTNIP